MISLNDLLNKFPHEIRHIAWPNVLMVIKNTYNSNMETLILKVYDVKQNTIRDIEFDYTQKVKIVDLNVVTAIECIDIWDVTHTLRIVRIEEVNWTEVAKEALINDFE